MQIKRKYGRILSTLLASTSALLALATPVSAQEAKVVPGQILVRPKAVTEEANFAEILRGHGAHQKGMIPGIDVRIVGVPDDKAARVLEALSHNPNIEFAEWDYIATAFYLPNDPYLAAGTQWHHSTIQTPQAWDITLGLTNVTIAVLDTGVDATHPDLRGKLLAGYNYIGNNNNTADDQGHGTAVAGTAASYGNNSVGGAGVAMNSYILPVKILDASGNGSYSAIANGINFAANRGARVINLSVGGPSSSSTLQSAIDYAWNKNCVIIAAAGNGGNNTPQYPGACRNVVAVSATDSNDTLTYFSSYGSYVSVSAPGQDILTTLLGGGYGAVSGTSFSCPVTAGVGALVAATNPQLSNGQIVNILKTTTDDLGASGYDVYYGNGRVNASRAVKAAIAPVVADITAPTVQITSPANATSVFKNVKIAIGAQDNVGVTRIELYIDGKLFGTSAVAPVTFTWNAQKAGPGQHTIQAVAFDAAGNRAVSSVVTVIR